MKAANMRSAGTFPRVARNQRVGRHASQNTTPRCCVVSFIMSSIRTFQTLGPKAILEDARTLRPLAKRTPVLHFVSKCGYVFVPLIYGYKNVTTITLRTLD